MMRNWFEHSGRIDLDAYWVSKLVYPAEVDEYSDEFLAMETPRILELISR